MTQQTHPIVDLTQADLDAMLLRALRNTLILGALAAAAVLIGNARLDRQKTPANAPVVVLFFVLRLTVFAGVIYGSLKFLRGSAVALLCGLSLAVLAIGWEAIRLLRD